MNNNNILQPPTIQNIPINNINPIFIPQKNKGDSGTHLPYPNERNIQKKEIKEDDYVIEMFGRVGWICDQCNNFNYDTRNKCNRCGIPKSPKKISKLKRKLENKKKEQMKLQQSTKKDDDEKKKKLKERKGDWICAKCGNLNFSFRIICNRCQLPKKDSDILNTPMSLQYNDNMMYNYSMNFVNNGEIYCNNMNVLNQNRGNNIEEGEI